MRVYVWLGLLVALAAVPLAGRDAATADPGGWVTTVGIDMEPDDNTPNNIVDIETCRRIDAGNTDQIDVFFLNFPPAAANANAPQNLAGYNYFLTYPALVGGPLPPGSGMSITAKNHVNQYISLAPPSGPSDATADHVPDNDGTYDAVVADFATAETVAGQGPNGILGHYSITVGADTAPGYYPLQLTSIRMLNSALPPKDQYDRQTPPGIDSDKDGAIDEDLILDGTYSPQYGLVAVNTGCPGVNEQPDTPSVLRQLKSDGVTEIGIGDPTDESTVVFKATVSDPDNDQVRLEIELRRLDEDGGNFTGKTWTSDLVQSGSEVTYTRPALVAGKYHWRARAVDEHDVESAWVSFGGNDDSEADFTYTVPTCVVKLQKDGVRIDQVDVGEFFDVYLGDSADSIGIKEVRFSSDDVQDRVPTGEWTEWYDWDISSGDWNAGTKIKRWAFATPGYKEVWVQARRDIGETAECSGKILVPAPALPVITSPLVLSPAKDIYSVGDSLEARFTMKNVGTVPITLDVLTVGGRLDGFIPAEGAPDFTLRSLTLQPNQSYQYEGSLTLTHTGNYHFFVAYYIDDPTSAEKRLLDDNNWNTRVELGEGLTHTGRAKNIIVFEEGVVPEEVSQLREAIDRQKSYQLKNQYPSYLLDPNSFSSAVGTLWASFTSVVTATDLTQMYDQLYFTGIDFQWLSFQAAVDADHALESGNLEGAKKYLQRSYKYERLSQMSYCAAAEVFDGNLEAGEILARGIMEGSEAAVSVGIAVVWPPAAAKVDLFYGVLDFAFDCKLEGFDQATKNAIAKVVTKTILSGVSFESLDGETIETYVNRVSTGVKLDTLLRSEEFMTEFGLQLRNTIVAKIVVELGIWIDDELIQEVVKSVEDRLWEFVSSIQVHARSPVELRVLDPNGQVTGLIDGKVRHEIPMSLYYDGTVTVHPTGSYRFVVAGVSEGTYGLEVASLQGTNTTTFDAANIPVSPGATHQYAIDWDALSGGEEGVTVQIDSDADGVFEEAVIADADLTLDEFISQVDGDGDGIADAGADPDGSGPIVTGPDNCLTVSNPGQEDTDGDGVGDACEAPPAVGGVVELQVGGSGSAVDVPASPGDSSGPNYLALVGVGALVVGALTAGAWYARRRWGG